MINQEKLNMDFQNKLNRLQEIMNLINSNQDPPVDLYDLKGSDRGDNKIDSLTMKPSDTFLIGDKVISTTPERDNDEFINSSVYDLVPIPRESKTTSTRDRKIDFNPSRDIEELEPLLADDPVPVPVPKVFDEPLGDDTKPRSYDDFEDISSLDPPKLAPLIYEPLGNPDLVSRSLETRDLILEELTTEIGLDDLIPTEIDDGYYDSEETFYFWNICLSKRHL
ncbi:hypothetical protein Tco_1244835 [Tanacetum coccineum]